ncbi:uncharacterized acetyltransferase At3g50280-like [Cucurbita maxima]|uniref:Uncharacterized acetyltransferase At3g50280-like n=1 Tax=Cucurbita maxima TaxID=3661 RepID=A0A6J1J4C3_CUCMA|nr:uncharacterized acetyltransferase At3g50280-like [Cucurbita maxima]
MKPQHPSVRRISECFLKPDIECLPQESKQPYYLSHWDLNLLPIQYIQKGLLFRKPSEAFEDGHPFMATLLHRLKRSLSSALFHFYPLSGRLASIINEHQASILVYVDCVNTPGAKFTHAALDLTISHLLSPVDVPLVVHSLFDPDLHTAVNYDGHTLPLLSIQVTELLDGIFIGSSFNHSIGDGTSHWNFFKTWSEIFQSLPPDGDDIVSISRPPIRKRWFPDGHGPIINLPFTHSDQFKIRFKAPELRERIFHFTKESIAALKAKANAECGSEEISSFQAMSALVWRSITRARRQPQNQITICRMVANNRAKLEVPTSEDYFGNVITTLKVSAKAGEVVEGGLGWAAWKLHEAVVDNTKEKFREAVEQWFECPCTFRLDQIFVTNSLSMTSSPKFNIYGNEFGMGKAVAVRSGCANKFDGKVSSYPGYEGGGSVDLEIALFPHNMANLEADSEFMSAVSSPPHLFHQ